MTNTDDDDILQNLINEIDENDGKSTTVTIQESVNPEKTKKSN